MVVHVIDSIDDPRVIDHRNVPDAELLRTRGVFVAEGRQAADDCARIDMAVGVDSLRVATASGIALYACRRRLGWPTDVASC